LEAGIRDVTCGVNVRIVSPANLYGCSIGDDVFVGPFVEIQNDVSIGARSKIQSHAFICSQVTIGADCFIGHGVMFVNDTFSHGGPARGDKTLWKNTHLGNRVSVGSNVTLLPVDICDDVVIGAGSVVTKSISEPGIYAGNPVKLIRKLVSKN
jgi:acetyltransferase-like isoleucine patch superfamily enzyme